PRPIQPAVHVTPAAPAPSEPVRVTRATPPETTVASALGGATIGGARPLLPPPVPVSPAAAATLDGMRGASPAR
ncbi:hypothetical protein, partial [Falsiroseomonas sp. HW251]|uniref:hypothetical protein n=1 Tax=Falsiroseomonas sp. HW251 TaxID=3390998 RepID=UPI003D31D8F4